MNKNILLSLLAAVGLLGTGCIETNDDFKLNPDGSGKVVHEAKFQPINLNMSGKPANPEAEMKKAISDELEQAKGVDAWSEVAFRRLEDGRIWFKGTAYFTDFAKLKLHNGGVSQNNITPVLSKTDKGLGVLQLGGPSKKAKADAAPVKLTEEQITQKIQAERTQFQQMRPMLVGFMATLKEVATYHLPGPIEEIQNFAKVDAQSVQLTFDGAKMLAALDELAKDDTWWREQAAAGNKFGEGDGPMDDRMAEKLFGQKGPSRVTFKLDAKPLFDYATEVATAKQNFPQLIQTLGLKAKVATAAAKGGALKSVKVAGVQIVRGADSDNDIRPFNGEDGCSLSLIAELPGAVLVVNEGKLNTAVADNGTDLMPEREWDQKISFPRLSRDKSVVVFEVKTQLPGKGVRGLKELTGTLEYSVGDAVKTVDLGITKFTAGSQGKVYDATIKAVTPSPMDPESEQIELSLAVPHDAIKSATFYNAAGAKLEVTSSGMGWSGDETYPNYQLKGKFPAAGKIVLEIMELQKTEVPFSLINVPLQ